MSNIDEIISDVGCIVSSVRPCEIMSLKRIEDDYKAIYNKSIPFKDFGYPSLLELLKNYSNRFQIYMYNGTWAVRTFVSNNITSLIARERKSKKPKNFQNNNCVIVSRTPKFREMRMPTELPDIILRGLMDVVNISDGGIPKMRLLTRFKQYVGYECKFREYGFANEDELFQYLDGRAMSIRGDCVWPMTVQGPKLIDLLTNLVVTKTGYTLASIERADARIATQLSMLGSFGLADVINDARARGLLLCDQQFVYGNCVGERRTSRGKTLPSYPPGVSCVRVVRVVSPGDFVFEIVANESVAPRAELHAVMQQLAPLEPLLTMFADNRYCSVLHQNGEWYRARIATVTPIAIIVHLLDADLSLDRGESIPLPTDRLRFLPVGGECEQVPAYVYRGSLAYVSPSGDIGADRDWTRQSCVTFTALVSDESCLYHSYLVSDLGESVSIDLVAITRSREKVSLFQRLVSMGLARSTL